MEPSFDKLKDKYLTLPEELQDTISSPEAAQALYEIGKANGLRIDEMDVLSRQTGMVLLGITHPDQYIASLRNALPMSRDKAEPIARAVNEKIFGPIHDAIVNMHKHPTVPPPNAPSTPPPAATINPVQAQMAGAFRMAPDTVTLKPTPTAPVKGGTYTADPYREPVN